MNQQGRLVLFLVLSMLVMFASSYFMPSAPPPAPVSSHALTAAGKKRLTEERTEWSRFTAALEELRPLLDADREDHSPELSELWDEMTMVRRSQPAGTAW